MIRARVSATSVVYLWLAGLAIIVVAALLGRAVAGDPSAPPSTPSPTPSATESVPQLGVINTTTLTVGAFLNGLHIADYPPNGPPAIDVTDLPPLPWAIEARSPSGRVLTSLRVEPGAVWATIYPNNQHESTSFIGQVDLSCGRLIIWAGVPLPSGMPLRSSLGTPGPDCAP